MYALPIKKKPRGSTMWRSPRHFIMSARYMNVNLSTLKSGMEWPAAIQGAMQGALQGPHPLAQPLTPHHPCKSDFSAKHGVQIFSFIFFFVQHSVSFFLFIFQSAF